MTPLPHGGNIEAMAKQWHCRAEDILDLSTGLHPAGAPIWLGTWLQKHARLPNHYPERQGEPARTALANFMGVQPEQVLILAGAQAGIEILPQAMNWTTLAIKQPCYSEPVRAAKRAGCHVVAVDMQATTYPDTDAIWITSPHNPFGHEERFPPSRHGVLDESYMPFLQRRQLGISTHMIRLGSFTKTFGIPGLRLGYIIAEEVYIRLLKAWLPPWGTSTLANHLLPELLPEAQERDEQMSSLRKRMHTLLTRHNWIHTPSKASFILTKPPSRLPDFDSSRILVRHFPEWKSLTGWVRLGYPLQTNDWQRLEHALATADSG